MRYLRNIVLVATSIIILSLVTVVVSAQTDADTAKENVSKHSEYALPYPGLLPGNPLYEIKMLRDRIFESLIVDPVKRADFYLLQADKRLAAGMMLLKNNKRELSEETISKGEKYFLLSVQAAFEAKKQGRETKAFTDRLARSWEKHFEVLGDLSVNGPRKELAGFNSSFLIIKDVKLSMIKYFNGPSYSLPFPVRSVTPTPTPIVK